MEAGVTMETVVIVAIGVLATIFLASFVALVVVCRHRYCHPHDLLHHFDSKSVKSRLNILVYLVLVHLLPDTVL